MAQKPTKDSISRSNEQSVEPNASYCSVKRRAKNWLNFTMWRSMANFDKIVSVK